MLEFIESHPVLCTFLLPAASLLFPQVWRWLGRWMGRLLRWVCGAGDTQALILAEVRAMRCILDANGERLCVIEKEMKFNGGQTIKDMLFLLFNYRRHDYWRIGRPAMEMDGNAQVQLVSEAACRLFGVANPDDLKRRSWLRFIPREMVDDLLNSYQESVRFQSEFTWRMHVTTADGEHRGEWELRAAPISQEDSANKIWSGFLGPCDEVSRKVAAEMHWIG